MPKFTSHTFRHPSLLLLGLCPAFAWACIRDESSKMIISEAPIRIAITVLVAELLILGSALATRWAARKLWPNIRPGVHDVLYYLSVVSAIILSAGLGLFGSVALPIYERTFAEIGMDVPMTVSTVFRGRHFLWIGLVATLYLFWISHHAKPVATMAFAGLANVAAFILIFGILMTATFSHC